MPPSPPLRPPRPAPKPSKTVLVAEPHGFCAGVRHAVQLIRLALERFPPPIYCLNELVHNRQVVEKLTARGVRFVRSVDRIPENECVLFSAHGVPPEVREQARKRNLRVIDATCPYVHRVHTAVRRYARRDFDIFLIGHTGHDEIIGVRGEAPGHVRVVESAEDARTFIPRDPGRVAALTQTTLSVEGSHTILNILRERFPRLETSPQSDICLATQNRQNAVRGLSGEVRKFLVLGSPNSSNTARLVETARSAGCPAQRIGTLDELAPAAVAGIDTLGLTAGASTPEDFVDTVLERLSSMGFTRVARENGVREEIRFPVTPASLRDLGLTEE